MISTHGKEGAVPEFGELGFTAYEDRALLRSRGALIRLGGVCAGSLTCHGSLWHLGHVDFARKSKTPVRPIGQGHIRHRSAADPSRVPSDGTTRSVAGHAFSVGTATRTNLTAAQGGRVRVSGQSRSHPSRGCHSRCLGNLLCERCMRDEPGRCEWPGAREDPGRPSNVAVAECPFSRTVRRERMCLAEWDRRAAHSGLPRAAATVG